MFNRVKQCDPRYILDRVKQGPIIEKGLCVKYGITRSVLSTSNICKITDSK